MSKQHRLGKYGTVFATRVELSRDDKDLHCGASRVTAGLHLDTRYPGPDYDQYPGLTINGIEYHVSAHALTETYTSGKVRVWLRHWRLRRAGSGAEATPKAQSIVHPLLLKLAEELFADPLWMAETDVELARASRERASQELGRARDALSAAQDGLTAAYVVEGKAIDALKRMRQAADEGVI